jgi:hypothetical protein
MSKNDALFIGNEGLGDMIACIGMVNFLSSKYQTVTVACIKNNYNQAKTFYTNPKIKIHVIDEKEPISMIQFDMSMRNSQQYDVYAIGHYGAQQLNLQQFLKMDMNGNIKPIIYDYPLSYYEDIQMPIEYMSKYLNIVYPKKINKLYNELFNSYKDYIVVHQIGSDTMVNLIKMNNININKILVIDVNKNLYEKNHKFYQIANKFINLPSILYYGKLLSNAKELYLIDSCIHVLALTQDLSKVKIKNCYQRAYHVKYGLDTFEYFLILFNTVVKAQVPLDIKNMFKVNHDIMSGKIKMIHQQIEIKKV